MKWYESPLVDESIVISARVRFARNFEKYPFPIKLTDSAAQEMAAATARAALSGNGTAFTDELRYFDITDTPQESLLPLMERHVLSSHMVAKKGVKGIILNGREDVSVMLNEEDHARIQSIFPGDNLDGAYAAADALDTLIEDKGQHKYAFDQEYGFLTSCPTNAGTGMRASLMLHLPALENTGYIAKMLPALGKFRMTVRGIHGEGSESLGAVYQISNQFSLGKPETEILQALKSAVNWIINQEKSMREKFFTKHRIAVEDKLYRSWGILTSCRTLDHKEGMNLLSDARMGFESGIYTMPRPAKTIYALMTNIQPGSLCAIAGKPLNQEERNIYRAEYIREQLKA
ncbi:MAG: protein arginine kinase [Defluviitaleaceae bacterium]|nr:protein arginine kinase [Defluviitaleaceae bacterium]MCL2835394.1 protein arginine kinase [Defluviitaleaceae bacterium]